MAVRDLLLLPLGVAPDKCSRSPLHFQIYQGLRTAILEGRLESGARLPSTRAAATELGVARNTVIAAFEQLAAEGFVRSNFGDGTRVVHIEPELIRRPATKPRTISQDHCELAADRFAPALSARGRAVAA